MTNTSQEGEDHPNGADSANSSHWVMAIELWWI